jgi:hypothetical protein
MIPVRHLLLGSMLAILVVPTVGCDSNPGGPSAPSVEVSKAANANAPPATPGVMPAKRGRQSARAATPPGVD